MIAILKARSFNFFKLLNVNKNVYIKFNKYLKLKRKMKKIYNVVEYEIMFYILWSKRNNLQNSNYY